MQNMHIKLLKMSKFLVQMHPNEVSCFAWKSTWLIFSADWEAWPWAVEKNHEYFPIFKQNIYIE